MITKQVVFGLAAGSLLLSSCGQGGKQATQGPPPAVPVTVQTVTTADAVYFDSYPATVVALNQVDLRPQVSGFITGIFFRDGERVRKGQKLYTIDLQQYEANYQQALANLGVQQTNLVKAQKDADRYHQLDRQDAIAKQQVDYADAALEAARRQVDAAKANVTAVQTSVRYATITAPFDGTIGISQVKLGSPVTAGQTVLNTVSTDNPVAVDIAVNQQEIYRFTQLQERGEKPGDSTFTLAFGTDVYPYPGRLSLLDRAVDPQTGTIRTRLVFPNAKGQLKPGMTGVVRVRNNSAVQAVVIPYKAVTEQLGEFFVYVVNDSSKVSQRKLVLGQPLGANIIVRDGLKPGERIAVQGVQNLREGVSVRIDSSAANGGTPAQAK
ncbi:MAG TPA: efflux RND transporter periplasmic adaptor subunit [Chitinophagaceae bacterium]|nr:efflux RND transporter periplasmic adaptor subunit [Chitinophagaceae bacterium]